MKARIRLDNNNKFKTSALSAPSPCRAERAIQIHRKNRKKEEREKKENKKRTRHIYVRLCWVARFEQLRQQQLGAKGRDDNGKGATRGVSNQPASQPVRGNRLSSGFSFPSFSSSYPPWLAPLIIFLSSLRFISSLLPSLLLVPVALLPLPSRPQLSPTPDLPPAFLPTLLIPLFPSLRLTLPLLLHHSPLCLSFSSSLPLPSLFLTLLSAPSPQEVPEVWK